ncbi:hypothetical protein [Sphingobium lignivorans]|uniref:HEAT repeat domain-containing protein n=1 Tax=Sphingobium lignivorans TaxID=2735886 RepID=A0ABR6NG84_9SPHN|nr:hypothetical protein [Sphingobium lignivorans]MBB5986293.1 hypothetical protein [Sphingobium lignivorans]
MKNAKTEAQVVNALRIIDRCTDPKQLERIAENAFRHGQDSVRHAALLKLYAVSPAAEPRTLKHDVWQSVFALEGALKDERGKTVLLSRTRQKIKRDGEHRTVADLVLGKVADGFLMLVERGMPQLTFEAVALHYPEEFDEEVLSAADARLQAAGFHLRG